MVWKVEGGMSYKATKEKRTASAKETKGEGRREKSGGGLQGLEPEHPEG